MSNIKLLQAVVPDKSAALDILDDLRKNIEDGTVVAFACVGIRADDGTSEWIGNVGKKSQLQFVGACTSLLHDVIYGQSE